MIIKKINYPKNPFLKKFKNNLFDNIVYIQGSDFKSVKIDDVRNLKKILQSSLINKDRFIIFDDIELFNHHSLNGLLKLIEEPTKNNYFFLIYNKSRPLFDTIKSRALEIKIILKEKERLEVIDHLKNNHKLEIILDPESSMLTPGNFVKFNYICTEYNILPTGDFLANMKLLLNLYKKKKFFIY